MRLSLTPAILAIPILLGIGACQPTSDNIGGRGRTEQIVEYVSLSPSTTELLHASGVTGGNIIGITSSCNFPPNLNKSAIVVNGITPNFESIAALKPQRVILEKDLYPESTIQKLKDLGLDVLVAELSTPETYEATLKKIAKDAGFETTASKYLDQVYGAASLLQGNMPEGARIAVMIGEPTRGYMIQSKNTLFGAYIERAGATDVGPDTGKFEKVTTEQLLAANPTMIITELGAGEKMLKDPALKSIPAIANGHIIAVDPDILLRDGGRVDKLLEGVATGIGRIASLKGN